LSEPQRLYESDIDQLSNIANSGSQTARSEYYAYLQDKGYGNGHLTKLVG